MMISSRVSMVSNGIPILPEDQVGKTQKDRYRASWFSVISLSSFCIVPFHMVQTFLKFSTREQTVRCYEAVKNVVTVEKIVTMDTKPFIVAFCLVWLCACAVSPSTQERTIRQGSDRVEKACTEKPSGCTDVFESGLKVKLPLGSTPEPQAENVLKRYNEVSKRKARHPCCR